MMFERFDGGLVVCRGNQSLARGDLRSRFPAAVIDVLPLVGSDAEHVAARIVACGKGPYLPEITVRLKADTADVRP